jgi:hypothetical protein
MTIRYEKEIKFNLLNLPLIFTSSALFNLIFVNKASAEQAAEWSLLLLNRLKHSQLFTSGSLSLKI